MNVFMPGDLLAALQRLPACRHYWVAYSGGRDSHVLLHALAALRQQLTATIEVVHVDHGLHPQSSQWLQHCQSVCDELNLTLINRQVNARPDSGESPEAAARKARYAVLAELLSVDDILLTAHHQDDQAETLLLQLLRGAGPHGLAAMPVIKPFASGYLARPLLDFSRDELDTYARHHDLHWIDDPSNEEPRFKRNYLRHDIMPRLHAQWPACSRTLARSASLSADAASLLDQLAAQDMLTLTLDEGLSVARLQALEPNRQRNVLRFWCASNAMPLPSQAHLLQIQHQMLSAADSVPLVSWPGAQVRRYQGCLTIAPPMLPVDTTQVLEWDMQTSLKLPHGLLSVTARCDVVGLDADLIHQQITVRFRQGGERWQTAAGQHQALKKILQHHHVAPWQRDRWPLIYINGELAAIAGVMVCDRYIAGTGQPSLVLEWQPY
jgi:tRNA(Ile)-lysidine synthase